jgi:hypothetical protein
LKSRFERSSRIEWPYCAALAIHYLMQVIDNDTITGLLKQTVCVGLVDESEYMNHGGYVDAYMWLSRHWHLVRRLSSPNFPLGSFQPCYHTDVEHWTQCLECIVKEQTGVCWRGVGVGMVVDVDTSELIPLSFWRYLGIDVGAYCHWYHHKTGSVQYPDSELGDPKACGLCPGLVYDKTPCDGG